VTLRAHRLACAALLWALPALAPCAQPPPAVPAAASAPLPGDSIYALHVPLERADGGSTTLAAFRGHAVLLAMFYSRCNSACPLLVERVRALARELAPAERARLSIVLVSLDPEHDNPAALTAFAAQHHVGAGDWTLARTTVPDTRALATVLGIRYRNNPDGSITHAAPIALFDGDGVLIARTLELGSNDSAFENALHRALGE